MHYFISTMIKAGKYLAMLAQVWTPSEAKCKGVFQLEATLLI